MARFDDWRTRLTWFDGPTRLGRGVTQSTAKSPAYQQVSFAVTPAEYAGLAGTDPDLRLAQLLAAWCVCLHRFSGRDLVTVGTWHRGAVRPLLVRVRAEATFPELVTLVSGELSRDDLDDLSRLGLVAQADRHPLFEVGCALATASGAPPALPCPIELALAEEGGLTGLLRFDAETLDAEQARALTHYFRQVVTAASAEPAASLARIGALSPEDHDTVVVDWNRTDVAYGPEHRVHRLVEAQAAAQPEAEAVSAETGSFTYAELNRMANRLAHHLVRDRGVRPGDVVAVAAERSPELIACLLAVLKAGAAYLPLDPAHPEARLRLMLDDARPVALLTLSRHAPGFTGLTLPVSYADDAALLQSSLPEHNPDCPSFPDSLLCLIYTSGTTGRPKAVMLTHRGVANSLRWEEHAYQLDHRDRLLHLASCAFSLAIVEIFSPLCVGGTVVVAPPSATRDSSTIARLVGQNRVTVLSVVPSELKLLLEQEPGMPWTAIRRVITGADVLPRQVHDRYFATCPSVPLFNIYGQTESAVDGAYWICRTDDGYGRVPVGRPIANARMYVLDNQMRPVPVGAPGVLYTGGAGLAWGYLGRPDLTADRFVPDPFAREPGQRLYRSGDLARWLPGGVLELLGREDHQVQVSGIRVELEEIESVLRRHPGVRDVAVAMHTMPEPGAGWVPADATQWAALLEQADPDAVERLLAEAEQGL